MGIVDNIQEDLLQQTGIPYGLGQVRIQITVHSYIRDFEGVALQFQRLQDHVVDVDRNALRGIHA